MLPVWVAYDRMGYCVCIRVLCLYTLQFTYIPNINIHSIEAINRSFRTSYDKLCTKPEKHKITLNSVQCYVKRSQYVQHRNRAAIDGIAEKLIYTLSFACSIRGWFTGDIQFKQSNRHSWKLEFSHHSGWAWGKSFTHSTILKRRKEKQKKSKRTDRDRK